MMHKIIYLCLLILAPLTLHADGNDALFEAANKSYTEGKFEEAITSYEQILQTGQESAEVYYNLGNAYFKTGSLSRAILNYERGLLLAPGDEDILYNLAIANELITDKIEKLPGFFLKTWLTKLRNVASANTWAILSLVAFLLSFLFIAGFVFVRRRMLKHLLLASIISGLLISIVSIQFARQQSERITERNTAIVFDQSVTVKSSPDTSGNDLFILHEGVKTEIIDQLSGWYEIRLADGNVGWIPETALIII